MSRSLLLPSAIADFRTVVVRRESSDNEDMSGDDCQDEKRPHKYMYITNVEENLFQDDMKSTASEVSDDVHPR